jgi:hypothetical protein
MVGFYCMKSNCQDDLMAHRTTDPALNPGTKYALGRPQGKDPHRNMAYAVPTHPKDGRTPAVP